MIPLYSSEQVRKADNYAIKQLGIPGIVLMENASINIYESILEYFGSELVFGKIGIVTGKGNNGGDGFALARHFLIDGFDVKIISLAKESELKGDALINYKIVKKMLKNFKGSNLTTYGSIKDLSKLSDCTLIIDAMLGTGAKGNLRSPYDKIVKKINGYNTFKVAVDIPTGLDADLATGDIILNADLTVTLAELKTGLFYEKGYVHAGEVYKGSIGIDPLFFDTMKVDNYLIEPEDAFIGLPEKKLNDYKYSAGKVLTIAGSGGLPGAAFFTANTVLKSGAGASLLAFPKSMRTLAQKKLEESILLPYDDQKSEYLKKENLTELKEKIKWADVLAVGPGIGREQDTQEAVVELLKRNKNKIMVLDADAVYALKSNNYQKVDLKNKILTPHHKEFADLIGISVKELESNILDIGKKFAVKNTCHLVLKGAPTIIFNPSGEAFINTSGNPGEAKFGTGDVLTGMIAGFLAQDKNIERVLVSAVYLHSLSADLLLNEKTEFGYTATDILNNIPNTIKFIRDTFAETSY